MAQHEKSQWTSGHPGATTNPVSHRCHHWTFACTKSSDGHPPTIELNPKMPALVFGWCTHGSWTNHRLNTRRSIQVGGMHLWRREIGPGKRGTWMYWTIQFSTGVGRVSFQPNQVLVGVECCWWKKLCTSYFIWFIPLFILFPSYIYSPIYIYIYLYLYKHTHIYTYILKHIFIYI